MSTRLPIVDNLCTNPDNHAAHMCELRRAGRAERLRELAVAPRYICNNCAASANEAGALCAPGPLDKED